MTTMKKQLEEQIGPESEYIEVSDISGRSSIVKKSSLKPSVWAQGHEVSTHI